MIDLQNLKSLKFAKLRNAINLDEINKFSELEYLEIELTILTKEEKKNCYYQI